MSERKLINTIRKQFTANPPGLVRGIGDDCAIFTDNEKTCWLVTSDLLTEHSHFILAWHDPFTLGRKSVAVNLSDIAAMGGNPRFILSSLIIPRDITTEWLSDFHRGVEDILQEHNCYLIGGDTTSGEVFSICVTAIGSASPDNIIYRSGAKKGQDIYVTGPLGTSFVGLELLRKGYGNAEQYQNVIKAHLDPSPQVKVGSTLAASRLIDAMQDISDGLSTDISHICRESGVGAILFEKALPHLPELTEICTKLELDITNCMLHGGEDYQLVFTADTVHRALLQDIAVQLEQPFFRIGSVQSGSNVYLQSKHGKLESIQFKGFEHKIA